MVSGTKLYLGSGAAFEKTLSYSYSGDATNILQEALNTEEMETVKGKMIINEKKCHTITFNFSANNTPPQNLSLNQNLINSVDNLKLLGVMISKDLKGNENTSLICDKVNKKYYILNRLKNFGFTKE